ncbi:MAG: helix-turn-helix domain-containing protein [Chthoniobacter sp.]
MSSNKSRAPRAAVEPQRRHGKQRVATLLEVGAAVIAEQGYEAATMAEIAERAGAPIGSLYRFFPSKEILANALIERYRSRIDEAAESIHRAIDPADLDKTADALLHFVVDLRREMKAMSALLEVRSEWSAQRQEFRNAALKQIARTLTLLAPALPRPLARDMAIVLLLNMKTMSALTAAKKIASTPGALEELRHMNRLYLADRLAPYRRTLKS